MEEKEEGIKMRTTSAAKPLHIVFFPLVAQGHVLPVVDMAKLFAVHAVRTTVVTTPANVVLLEAAIADDAGKHLYRHPVGLVVLPSPPGPTGVPDGCENLASIRNCLDHPKFVSGLAALQEPFRRVLEELRPDAVVTDYFLPWTLDVAHELNIPRIVFQGTSFFAICAMESLTYNNLLPDEESFLIPGFPRRIEMLRSQIPDASLGGTVLVELMKRVAKSDRGSYGVVVNSFYELEPEFADHCRRVLGKKVWHIGPVSLCSKQANGYAHVGDEKAAGSECGKYMQWLDTKEPRSVVYVCFGSMASCTRAQTDELARALEACGHPFIWVAASSEDGDEPCLPEGYLGRTQGRGMVVMCWAPQRLILNHRAVGCFVTHCGWNSCIESIAAGVPMVTWPMFAEQFFNEKLVVEVLGIGVEVGANKYEMEAEKRKVVAAGEIEKAVRRVMDGGGDGDGDEAETIRRRAEELADMAKRAVEDDGSSFVDVMNLVRELEDGRGIN